MKKVWVSTLYGYPQCKRIITDVKKMTDECGGMVGPPQYLLTEREYNLLIDIFGNTIDVLFKESEKWCECGKD